MYYQVFSVLDRDQVNRIAAFLATRMFVDGKFSAPGIAGDSKHNLQLQRTGPGDTAEIDRILISALQLNVDFQAFAIPKRLTLPLFSRYEPGMHYGPHVDNAIMTSLNGDAVRSDFAMTLFLSHPSSYDGGELVIETPAGSEEVKLDVGEAIVYSATALHHVAPVSRGVRLAAVAWVQSVVADERLRAILHDLGRATQRAESSGDTETGLLLSKSYHNLLRYAAEP